ncbi:MAG: hypothetical protein HN347_00330, partial [Bacteroidetes bacterium]|nr:hypothetical protein [Bacteroidota bacterium]
MVRDTSLYNNGCQATTYLKPICTDPAQQGPPIKISGNSPDRTALMNCSLFMELIGTFHGPENEDKEKSFNEVHRFWLRSLHGSEKNCASALRVISACDFTKFAQGTFLPVEMTFLTYFFVFCFFIFLSLYYISNS